MRNLYLLLFMSIMLILVSCSNQNDTSDIAKDIKSLVHYYSTEDLPEDVTASITSHKLIVNEAGKEKIYDLPEDDFFVSIAPFKTTTHECQIHSLTGCQGELVDESLHVYIEDEVGKVIKDEELTIPANGFIDLWLPRDRTYTIKFSQGDYEAEGEISSFEGDDTCITTIQLSKSS